MSLTMQYFIMESGRNWWNGFLMLVSRSGVFSFFFLNLELKKFNEGLGTSYLEDCYF